MDTIFIDNIEIQRKKILGGYSDNYKCKFNNNDFMFKKFLDADEMITPSFTDKINEINKLSDKLSYLPQYWVLNKSKCIGYLTKLHPGRDIGFAVDKFELLNLLKDAKEKLLYLHELGLIHGDIHYCNILFDEGSTDIIDFDNSSYLGMNPEFSLYSTDARNFVSSYGVSKELDIFLFNLMTFEVINDLYLDSSLYDERYGLFKDNEAKRICDSLRFEKSPSSDFLIDTESVKKLVKTK